jgi:hypothetical protein
MRIAQKIVISKNPNNDSNKEISQGKLFDETPAQGWIRNNKKRINLLIFYFFFDFKL